MLVQGPRAEITGKHPSSHHRTAKQLVLGNDVCCDSNGHHIRMKPSRINSQAYIRIKPSSIKLYKAQKIFNQAMKLPGSFASSMYWTILYFEQWNKYGFNLSEFCFPAEEQWNISSLRYSSYFHPIVSNHLQPRSYYKKILVTRFRWSENYSAHKSSMQFLWQGK